MADTPDLPVAEPTERAALHAGPPADGRGYVLVLAGGGYTTRSDHECRDVVEFLGSQGIPSGYLDYPVAPARYPDALVEVLIAISDLRAGRRGPAGGVQGPIAVLGFSAGGHLAGTTATATPAELALAAHVGSVAPDELARPDAAVLCYPVVSLVERPHLGSRLALLGDSADAPARQLSVETRIDDATPPTFLWHTAEDQTVDVEHSLLAMRQLHRYDVPAELHVFPYGIHGAGLAPDVPGARDWTGLCVRWLVQQGIGRTPVTACLTA